jgi:hypothetical protein
VGQQLASSFSDLIALAHYQAKESARGNT